MKRAAVATEVTLTEIVRQKEDDVRLSRFRALGV